MKPLILAIFTTALVSAAAPRNYRFVVKYQLGDTRGNFAREETIVGFVAIQLSTLTAAFTNASLAKGSQPPEPLPYLKDFSFSAREGAATMRPEFFKNFPADAFEARNLIWDTLMFLAFSQTKFETLNRVIPFARGQQMELAGTGAFNNKNVELVFSGYGEHNGKRCLLLDYRALANPLSLKSSGMEIHGRSHYWGQIWLAVATSEIEYGTLFEDVVMEMTPPGQNTPTVSDVLRTGVLEPLEAR